MAYHFDSGTACNLPNWNVSYLTKKAFLFSPPYHFILPTGYLQVSWDLHTSNITPDSAECPSLVQIM